MWKESCTLSNFFWVPLMCVFRKYIKSLIFENIFLKIKKTVNIFLIFEKIFLKIINYCMLLRHTSKIHFVLTIVYIPIGRKAILLLVCQSHQFTYT